MNAVRSQPGRVLILDADLPPALSIVRSLHRKGLTVEIASHEEKPLTGYSRHVAKRHRYPDPLLQEDAFVDWIAARIADGEYNLIVPVTERSVTPLIQQRARLDDRILALAPSDALAAVLDKSRTMSLASELSIPTPASYTVTEPSDVTAVADKLPFPIVVKPASSVGKCMGENVQLTVSYAINRTELIAQTTHALRHGSVLLQELFSGDGVGVELIADKGKIVYAFQHKRLHEVPLTGGGSSLRMSVALEPDLLDASRKLIAALSWHGVAMVEFKHRPDTGEFRLMEINGRFWGSLPLAVESGADFPAMLHELMVDGKVGSWPPYRYPVYCRNLARDITWHELVLRRDAPDSIVAIPTRRQALHDLGLMFRAKHRFDVQKISDPLPGLIDIWRTMRCHISRVNRLLGERLKRAQQRKVWLDGSVATRLANASNLLFVCYGNINRSALAHAYAAQRLNGGIRLASAGFHEIEDRPADPVMLQLAADAGIDMAWMRSRTLTPAMVNDADMIFVMELEQRDRLLKRFPATNGKVFLLGMAAGGSNGDIPDPYGKDRRQYERAFKQVMASIDALALLAG